VLRDDGGRGLALRFVDPPAHTTRKLGRVLEGVAEIERCDSPGDAHRVFVAEVVQEERA